MSGYRRGGYRRNTGGAGSRWMTLRYAGQCKVCGAELAAGSFAFWDAATRAVTCERIECAEADGLTCMEWSGSPMSGQFVRVRAERRVGTAAPTVVVTRFNSGAVTYRNARGRCEDAPCCGCCD
jgi:hypothetical protein